VPPIKNVADPQFCLLCGAILAQDQSGDRRAKFGKTRDELPCYRLRDADISMESVTLQDLDARRH
jgi:hypothetical protein